MNTTNVEPNNLNYTSYTGDQYDEDIVRVIPFYHELHEQISFFLKQHYQPNASYRILDLGVGTGITSKMIQDILPNTRLEVVDFSEDMLQSARQRLGDTGVQYICANYAEQMFEENAYDIVISVIGLHHQNTGGKKGMFKKIYNTLRPGGVFILGDLMYNKDSKKQAVATAHHFHYMVEHLNPARLEEWSYHHLYLNDCATASDQVLWLEQVGFQEVEVHMHHHNTALITAKKEGGEQWTTKLSAKNDGSKGSTSTV